VLAPGARLTEDEVIAHTREQLGSIQQVTRVVLVDQLLKSGVSKILRRAVRDDVWRSSATRVGRP
jgi:acyl-coenzyme A synthetase/AMP-(fatty) acid ligase